MLRRKGFVNYVIMAVLALLSAVYLFLGFYWDAAVWILLAVAFLGAARVQSPGREGSQLWTRVMYGATIAAAVVFVLQIVRDRL